MNFITQKRPSATKSLARNPYISSLRTPRYDLAEEIAHPSLTHYQSAIIDTLERVLDPNKQRITLTMITSPYASETHLIVEPTRQSGRTANEIPEESVENSPAEDLLLSALVDTFDKIEARFDSMIKTVESTLAYTRRAKHGKRA